MLVGGHVRGEPERHGGAISCGEVGRAIHELTTGGNLNLRGVSTDNRRDEQNATTDIDVSRRG